MYKGIAFILAIILSSHLFSQPFFERMYTVAPDGNDRGGDLFLDEDGFWLFSLSLCDGNQNSCRGIIKTDWSGEVVWEKLYQWDPPSRFFFVDTEKMADGNYLTCGVEEVSGSAFYRSFLTKMTPTGDTLWFRRLDEGLIKHHTIDIEPDETGEYWLYSSGGVAGEYSEVIVVKVDEEGGILWETPVEDSYQFVLGGTGNMESLPDKDLVLSYQVNMGFFEWQAVVARTDSLGEVEWMRAFDQVSHPTSSCRVEPQLGGGFVLGWCRDTIAWLNHRAGINPVIYGLDEAGNILWENYLQSWNIRRLSDLTVQEDGSIFVCGTFDTDYAWLAKLSPAGELLWEREFRLPQEIETWGLEFNEMTTTPDGGVAMVGSRPVPYDTLQGIPVPKFNVWLVKTDADGCLTPGCQDSVVYITATEEPGGGPPAAREVFFRLSPNPTPGPLRVDFYQPLSRAPARLRLFDLRGRELARHPLERGATGAELNLSEEPPGVYVLTLEAGGRVLQTERVVRR